MDRTSDAIRRRGNQIVKFLNLGIASDSRVATLIALTQKVVEVARSARIPEIGFEDDDLEELEFYKEKINEITCRREYSFNFKFVGLDGLYPDAAYFEQVPQAADLRVLQEAQIVASWGELSRAGEQWRIRQCRLKSCNRYFYVERPHHVFHDTRCKERSKSCSKSFKSERAERVLKSRIDEVVQGSTRARLIDSGYKDTGRRSRCPDLGCSVEIQWWTRPRAERWKEIPLKATSRGLSTHWPRGRCDPQR